MQQILWLDVMLKAAVGGVLLVAPLMTCSLAGLERPATPFWPRLVGGLVLGIAGAAFVALRLPDARGGLGAAGLIAINLGTAAAILVPLILGSAAPTRRGQVIVVVNLMVLLVLAFAEIALL